MLTSKKMFISWSVGAADENLRVMLHDILTHQSYRLYQMLMKCIGFHCKLGRPRHHSTTDYVVSGVHKGFSGLMNLVANSGEQQSNLLFVNFNQDCT